jgi:hypothetical protein
MLVYYHNTNHASLSSLVLLSIHKIIQKYRDNLDHTYIILNNNTFEFITINCPSVFGLTNLLKDRIFVQIKINSNIEDNVIEIHYGEHVLFDTITIQ